MALLPALLWVLASPAQAIWQDDLFGTPESGYFAAVYGKLLAFTEERYLKKGDLSGDALAYLRLCSRRAPAWYLPGPLRLARFQVVLAAAREGAKKTVRVRCLPEPNPELARLTRRLLARVGREDLAGAAIGLELTFGGDDWAVILPGRELRFRAGKAAGELTHSAFTSGPPPAAFGFEHPVLALASASAHDRAGPARARLELKAYLDGVLPSPLRADVEAYHREFGLLADTLLLEKGSPTAVCFP